jgi:hypothetical protein
MYIYIYLPLGWQSGPVVRIECLSSRFDSHSHPSACGSECDTSNQGAPVSSYNYITPELHKS